MPYLAEDLLRSTCLAADDLREDRPPPPADEVSEADARRLGWAKSFPPRWLLLRDMDLVDRLTDEEDATEGTLS